MESDELVRVIRDGWPYPDDIDQLEEIGDEVHFRWRGQRFAVGPSLSVRSPPEETQTRTNRAVLGEMVLKRSYLLLYQKRGA